MPTFQSRYIAIAVASLTLAIGSAGVGYLIGSPTSGRYVKRYLVGRARVVSYQTSNFNDGYVLLAGDSNAELALPDKTSCGRKFLNAGVSGAQATDYLDFLDRLTFQRRPAVAVVTLGTNHLLRKLDPAGQAAGDRYESELAAVVERLSKIADRVMVAAVPPAGAALDKFLDRAGVIKLTQRQKLVCDRLGCENVDPYASYRESEFALARQDATHDGFHLSEYATAYRAIDADLCRP